MRARKKDHNAFDEETKPFAPSFSKGRWNVFCTPLISFFVVMNVF